MVVSSDEAPVEHLHRILRSPGTFEETSLPDGLGPWMLVSRKSRRPRRPELPDKINSQVRKEDPKLVQKRNVQDSGGKSSDKIPDTANQQIPRANAAKATSVTARAATDPSSSAAFQVSVGNIHGPSANSSENQSRPVTKTPSKRKGKSSGPAKKQITLSGPSSVPATPPDFSSESPLFEGLLLLTNEGSSDSQSPCPSATLRSKKLTSQNPKQTVGVKNSALMKLKKPVDRSISKRNKSPDPSEVLKELLILTLC
ncbi:hypothetical protein LINPERPRIM_LOCUS33801 [Linum perenne]